MNTRCKPVLLSLIAWAAIPLAATGVQAQKTVTAPTTAPKVPAFYFLWGKWFQQLTTYYQRFPKGRPALIKDPKDRFDLGEGWSVQIYNHGILEHHVVGTSGRLPRGEASYEICASWAIWRWSRPEIERNEDVLLHATANYVDSLDEAILRENTAYVEYEFTYAGAPDAEGTAELEAWWQLIVYAKADAPKSEKVAECGVHTAVVGKYRDGVGADLDWNGGARSASTSGLFPTSLKLTLLGVGVSVNLTSVADGSMVLTKGKGHRPRAFQRVRGTRQEPAVITVEKIAATSTGARVLADASTAGPGSSILDFHCWFRGRFGSVKTVRPGRREGK